MKKIISMLLCTGIVMAIANDFTVCQSGCSYKSIQKAIDDLNNSKGEYTIHIQAGKYNEALNISKSVNLIGEDPTNTIIDGENSRRDIYINKKGANIVIKNLQFINGRSGSGGGCLYIGGVNSLKIDNAIFQNCNAGAGGAIYIDQNVKTTIENSKFFNNSASNGGAIESSNANISIKNSEISGNTAIDSGGALYEADGSAILDNDILYNNTANTGGAIYIYGNFSGNRLWIVKNSAQSNGGAIYSSYSPTFNNITSSIIAYNKTIDGTGSAIYYKADNFHNKIIDSDIVYNQSKNNNASAIYIKGANEYILENNIFANNETDLAFEIGDQNRSFAHPTIAYNRFTHAPLHGKFVDVHTIYANEILDANTTFFTDPVHFDFSLSKNSPLIDSADISYALSYDIAGSTRPQGSSPDIGACEYPSVCKMRATKKVVQVCANKDIIYTVKEVDIPIKSGWTLDSIPYYHSITIEDIFGDNLQNVRTLWLWNANDKKWYVYSSDPKIKSIIEQYKTLDLLDTKDSINVGEGFWVNAKSSFTLHIPLHIPQE